MPVRVGLTIQKYQGMETSFALGLAKKFGLEYVELTHDLFEELDEILALVRGIRVGFHLPIICEDGWDFSCLSHKRKINDLIDALNQHWKALNIKYFLTHPPEPLETTAKTETSTTFLFENLQKLPGHIFIENVPSWKNDQFTEFVKQARKIVGRKVSGICLDAPHYYLTGEDPVAYISYWKEQIKCVHLSDCIRGHDLHLPFGSGGSLPVDEFLEALKQNGYNQYINLELLPKTFNDLPYVIYSYLKVLKKFRPGKYYRTKFRVLLILPLLRRLIPPRSFHADV